MWKYKQLGRKCFSVQVGARIHSIPSANILPDAEYLSTCSSVNSIGCGLGGYLIRTDYASRTSQDDHYWPGYYIETRCQDCPYYTRDN